MKRVAVFLFLAAACGIAQTPLTPAVKQFVKYDQVGSPGTELEFAL